MPVMNDMVAMTLTFDPTAVASLSRDGLLVDVYSGTALQTAEYIDEGAVWVQSTGPVTFMQPTLDPAFSGSGAEWIATAAMVEPDGLEKQGWDSRIAGGGNGPGTIYDARLGSGFPLVITPTPGEPQAVLLYRGRDTVQPGGSYTGAAAIVVVMVCYEEPAATAITPPYVRCPGGKPQITTADIDYNAIAPVAIPGGATEPDWTILQGYHRRCYIHTGGFVFSWKAVCNPEYTQAFYPAYQAQITSAVMIGAVSNSAARNTLINRIVRDGLNVDAVVKYHAPTVWSAGAGFGHGGGPMRWMAGLFLGDKEMMSRPGNLYNPYVFNYIEPFAEDDSYFLSWPSAEYPTPRYLFGVPNNSNGWPGPQAHFHNSTSRDSAGEREPHWIATSGGTAQGGTSNTITLAAGEAGMAGTWGNRMIWIYNGTNGGLGEGALVLDQTDWDDGTKTATLDRSWGTIPDATTVYEIAAAAENYQPIVVSAQMGAAIAIGLTGRADEYRSPQMAFWGFMKRHLNGGPNKPEPRWLFNTSSIPDSEYTYGDAHSGLWAQQFAATAEANFPVLNKNAILDLPLVEKGQMVEAVLTSATTANITVTTRQASGTVYWVSTASIVSPTAAQIEAGLNHTGGAALESGGETVTGAGAQTWAVAVSATPRYVHVVYKVGTDYSALESSRALDGNQWGLSYSTDFSADTSGEWSAFKTGSGAALTYDGSGQRLQVTQSRDWRGAWLTVPFQFERGLSYTITVNATNATAGTAMDFQLGTRMDIGNTNAEKNILEGSSQLGGGLTGDMTATIEAHGDAFFIAVKLRGGSSGDTFYINSVTVAQL